MAYMIWFIIGILIFYFIDASWGVWYFILTITAWAHAVDGTTGTYGSGSGGGCNSSAKSSDGYRRYEDNTYRVPNISESGFIYSDGSESWIGILGEEHREGTIVYENAYIPGQFDVRDENGNLIAHEIEDATGTTRRF